MSYDTLTHSTRRHVNSLAVDRVDEQDFQRVKLVVGDEGEAIAISAASPLPVAIISGGGGGGGGSFTGDITAVVPGTNANQLGKAEDAPHTSGDVGVMGLAVRSDSNVSFVNNSGDYSPLQLDANGSLKVAITAGAGSGGTASTDDAAFTAAAGSGTPIMGFATADSVDSGDVGVIAMTTLRAMHVQVQNSFIPITDNGGSLTVDGSVTISSLPALPNGSNTIGGVNIASSIPAGSNTIGGVNIASAIPSGANTVGSIAAITTSVTPGTAAANLGKAEDAAHTTGDVGVMALAVRQAANTALAGSDLDYSPLQVDAIGSLKVAIISGAGSGGTAAADGSTFTRTTTSLTPAGAVVETAAPTLTNGQIAGLSQTTAGALRVSVASGGIAGVVEDAASAGGEEGVMILAVRRDTPSSAVNADGDFAALSVNSTGALYVTGGGGGSQFAVDSVAGASDLGTAALAVRKDTLATLTPADGDYVTARTNARGATWVALDSTAAQNVTVAAALPAGANNIGSVNVATLPGTVVEDAASVGAETMVLLGTIRRDNVSTTTSTDGDYSTLSTDVNGRLHCKTQLISNAVGGHGVYRSIDLDETEEEVKAVPGSIFWIHAMNLTASVLYLKVYNGTAASVVVGTTTPVLTFPIPTIGSTNGAGFAISFGDAGVTFGTAISIAATTGIADTDTGAPATNACVVNLGFL